MKKKLKIPTFHNEDEERDFWAKTDLSEYLEASDFERVSFPNLKLTSHKIALEIPNEMLTRLKKKAIALHIPYQSLIKQYIAMGLNSKT